MVQEPDTVTRTAFLVGGLSFAFLHTVGEVVINFHIRLFGAHAILKL